MLRELYSENVTFFTLLAVGDPVLMVDIDMVAVCAGSLICFMR